MKKISVLPPTLGSVLILQGCLGGTSSSDDSLVVEGDFPVAFVQRHLEAIGNPTDGARYSPGGDLLMKDLSSASSETTNITGSIVEGPHDVSDPEVSYDGNKLLFSMRAPQWRNNTTWNIFEYDLQAKTLTRVVADDALANTGDDVDPAYLPDGHIVFSSNRQKTTREKMQAQGKVEPYAYRDEYEREATMVLHVLKRDLQQITQISFNQSHDRNPTVLMSGQIMFARWDHVGNRNHLPLFTTDPDGTNMFVQYGAFSPGNSYLHPREMPDGRVMSSLMPLSGTDEGGALMVVDVKNFTDNNQAANDTVTGSGQVHARPNFPASFGREFSEFGRYTTPYPLWDGTNRALVAFKANPKAEDAEVEVNPITGEEEAQESPPRYGIYMLDMDTDKLRAIALPDPGGNIAYTDPVAIIPRDENCLVRREDGCKPKIVPDVTPSPEQIAHIQDNGGGDTTSEKLAARGTAILNVKSVYDTDSQELMGDAMLVDGESIPKIGDVPDLDKMKIYGSQAYNNRVARFVRVTRAVPTPPGIDRDMIGESNLEMQQILGYAPIEPDGSFKIEGPADTPLTVAVLDKEGRAIQTHTNWIQARPGETRTCNGCHSPRRGSALNGPGIATHAGREPESGETMAETRTRLLADADPIKVPAMSLSPDIKHDDFWQQDPINNPDPLPSKVIDYTGLPKPPDIETGSDGSTTITINYEDHIQPLWETTLLRDVDGDNDIDGNDTCISCHNATTLAGALDLEGGVGGFGRLNAYQELVIGDPVLGPDGLPIITIDEDGEVMMEREAPLVSTGSSRQSSRTSHLIEKLYNVELRASQDLNPSGLDHSGMLNESALRVITEWIDIGGQYRNSPYVSGAGKGDSDGGSKKMLSEVMGGLQGLDEDVFDTNVHPILMNQCASCHQAFGNTGTLPDLSNPNDQFVSTNRFVLTGNPSGDFNVTVGMVSDVCDGQNNELLLRPTSDGIPPNPVHPAPNGAPVMNLNSPEYNTILNWIDSAAQNNTCS